MDHRRERNLLQSGTEYELVRSDFLMSNAQCEKNIWPSLFLFAGRVSGVFCMKINQENLNYSETNFIQNQAKVT